MTRETFNRALTETLRWEGGYANDGQDRGGETKFGISKRQYPGMDIAGLNLATATAIYYRDYWLAPNIDRLPPDIACKVFDTGVNMGPRKAVQLLQHAANAYRPAASQPLDGDGHSPELTIDGVIGPKTLARVAAIPAPDLLRIFRDYQEARYRQIVDRNPPQRRFLAGWLRRARA